MQSMLQKGFIAPQAVDVKNLRNGVREGGEGTVCAAAITNTKERVS